jgi:hypothetical protein
MRGDRVFVGGGEIFGASIVGARCRGEKGCRVVGSLSVFCVLNLLGQQCVLKHLDMSFRGIQFLLQQGAGGAGFVVAA